MLSSTIDSWIERKQIGVIMQIKKGYLPHGGCPFYIDNSSKTDRNRVHYVAYKILYQNRVKSAANSAKTQDITRKKWYNKVM
ncbi:hypothetical protein GCM10008022_44550 [Paenibacillus hunanensis]|nr:hypothetical protein GCM10008022_44550 [Paenibacillus hunanensis]